MLFDTRSSQAAEASLDALWMKSQVIANNMANADTPGFKTSSVSFDTVLSRAARAQNVEGREVSPQEAANRALSGGYRARVTTDNTTSVRVDGNNVVLEKEQAELWKTYAQYSYLLDRIGGHYNNISAVISNMRG